MSFTTLRDLMDQKAIITSDLAALEQSIAIPRATLAEQMAEVDAAIAEVRAGIEQHLIESGESSITDPDTRFNARIERRTAWKVTNRDELFAAATERPDLELLTVVVDEKKAIALSKEAAEALPGIECITTPVFSIHPPKERK